MQEPLYLVREDAAAIRRRTFRSRWEGFPTVLYGYNLLGYPKLWYIRAFVFAIIKSLTPYRVVDAYRKLQKDKAKSIME